MTKREAKRQLLILVEEYLMLLEGNHAKCDLESETDCYAAQYGDGSAEDHANISHIRMVLWVIK